MKAFPWKCSECGAKEVRPTLLPEYVANLKHDGSVHQVRVVDLPAFQCSSCHDIAIDENAGLMIDDVLRAAVNILKPEEIEAGRQALNLTQKRMAELLGIAESTISRWESGYQLQQRAMDRYLRVFFALPELREILSNPQLMRSLGTPASEGSLARGVGEAHTILFPRSQDRVEDFEQPDRSAEGDEAFLSGFDSAAFNPIIPMTTQSPTPSWQIPTAI